MWEITHARVYKEVNEEAQVDGKLCQLEQCQVLLPPEILSILGPEASQEVVGVHNHMHSRILCCAKDAVATRCKVCAKPNDKGHCGMMIDM